MARDGLDAVIVCGNEYTGFEGAVTYMSGFTIVHRYAYVLLPLEGDPAIVFPSEARYVGEHATTWIDEQVFVDRARRVARRPRPRQARRRLRARLRHDGARLPGARRRRRARAVGRRVRPRARRQERRRARVGARQRSGSTPRASGIFVEAFAPGKTEREILAPCERYFVDEGCGRLTMDMVLTGAERRGAARVPDRRLATASARPTCVLPSLEVAGPGGHWVEVSRAIAPGGPPTRRSGCSRRTRSTTTRRTTAIRDGATAHDVHRAVSKGFVDRGCKLGHVTGHSIGMTMIEFPKIGEGDETVLRENMVLSMHPHAISRRRADVPLHAGHVARHRRRRRAARGAADADLRRDGAVTDFEPVLPFPGASDYERYLQTDALLALQRSPEEWAHRDELLFMTVHQSSELWLKLACAEVEEATRLVESRRAAAGAAAAAPRRRVRASTSKGSSSTSS